MFVRNWIQNRGASGQLFTGGDSGTLSNPAQWLIDAIGGGGGPILCHWRRRDCDAREGGEELERLGVCVDTR